MPDHTGFRAMPGEELLTPADDGCELAFRIIGRTDRPAAVFSHPIGFDGGFWGPVAKRLAETFMLVVPDARGHGRSARGQGETSIEQLASDVLRIMDALNIEAAGFAGCSLGSTVGMYLGAHASARFEWLALANAPARIPLPRETFEQGIAGARAGALPQMARGMVGNWLADATKAAQPELADILLEQMLQTDGDGFADAFAALRDSDRNGDLGLIATPALVITGEADHAFPPAAAQAMGAAISGARTAVIAGAGHLAPAEQPERFAELIRDFVRGIPAARGHR